MITIDSTESDAYPLSEKSVRVTPAIKEAVVRVARGCA